MRTVVITAGGEYAQRILVRLATRDLLPDGLLLVSPLPGMAGGPIAALRGLVRRGPRRVAAGALRRALAAVEPGGFEWEAYAREVRTTGALNGPRMLADLRALAPDHVLLAGVGILRGEALAIPVRATINVHPGLLPWARGVGVVDRSIERGVAVGVSAHLVSEGIDTGAVIRRELVPVHAGDTLASLRRKADERCAELMVELAAGLRAGHEPEPAAQRGEHPYCTWPSRAEEERIDAVVRAGRALELYERWLELYGSRELRPGEERAPPVAPAA